MCSTFASLLAKGVCLLGLSLASVVPASAQILPADTCSLPSSLPQDALLYHVGSYGGTSSLGAAIELDNSGHEVRKVDVVVNLPDQPVVLALTAYDPVVWNVAWTAGSRIVGAVVSGYHGQAVLGLGGTIPIYSKTYHDGPRLGTASALQPCPYLYAYEEDRQYVGARDTLRKIANLPVSRFIAAPRTGIAWVGNSKPIAPGTLESSSDYRLEDFVLIRKTGETPAGARGLEELVRQGRLRHATEDDARHFRAPRVNALPTYVVLKPITIPGGLYGGHMVNFLLPKGVAVPKGNLGHSSLWREGDGCSGPLCEAIGRR